MHSDATDKPLGRLPTMQHTATAARVAVVADDLIWASRLRAAVENAGAQAIPVRAGTAIDAPFAVIDLFGRGYDGVEAVRGAASGGATVLAVSQHDDAELRKAALAAGAKRVLSYNKMFSDGPSVIARLVEGTL
jgi:DNA-binding NarL/FixJ family response regulator